MITLRAERNPQGSSCISAYSYSDNFGYPYKNVGHTDIKWKPSRAERSHQYFFGSPRCWNTHIVKKLTHTHQLVGLIPSMDTYLNDTKIMTFCGRRRCWVRDGGHPVGRMNSCGSYGGYYNSRKGKGRYITIRERV